MCFSRCIGYQLLKWCFVLKTNLKTSDAKGEIPQGVTIKTEKELAYMWEAGQVVAKTHQVLRRAIKPGITTLELDAIAEREIRSLGAIPAFKGYRGFPGTLCVSVNDEIVHGIPGKKKIKEGDLVSLDLGAIVAGLYGDAAVTWPVGEINDNLVKLLEIGEASLYAGIQKSVSGNRLGDVSSAIQREIESRSSYGIVREYVGHGIGRQLHEQPSVPNYGIAGRGVQLRANMAIAIEPMVNLGTHETILLDDDWTVKTADGKPSVHFEHTVIITEGTPIITTKLDQ